MYVYSPTIYSNFVILRIEKNVPQYSLICITLWFDLVPNIEIKTHIYSDYTYIHDQCIE